MEPMSILYSDSLDLLFENRNKLYGAYPLRKYYHRRLFAAMGTVSGVALVFTVLILFCNKHTGSATAMFDLPDPHLTEVVLDPPPPAPQPMKTLPMARRVASVIDTPPLIVRDELQAKPLATIEQLQVAVIGTKDLAGPEAPGDRGEQAMGSPLQGVGKDSSAEEKPQIFRVTEIMPEFPGGLEALQRYLLKNLHMPETDLEAGTRIEVMARFVVDAGGKVSSIEVTRSGGTAFDREVQRVIARMPAWKPGMQNHHPVAVYFNLPVSFVVPAGE